MRSRKGIFYNIDWSIILMYLILVFVGWINIYAAVFDEAHQSIFDSSQRYGKQLIWIGASLVIALTILMIDSKFFSTFAYLFYILGIISLLAVLVIGTRISGSKSWFQIGTFGLQPSEFVKFITCLALAKYLSAYQVSLSKFKHLFYAGVLIFSPALLILLQPDTGSTLVYISLIFVLFREGLSGNYLVIGASAAALFVFTLLFNKFIVIGGVFLILLLVFLLYLTKSKRNIFTLIIILLISSAYIFSVDYTFENVLQSHQKDRINVLIGKESDPRGIGYNVNQSKIAIGSGGLSGKGFLKGTQTKFNFVPEQSTDFIFCTIGEEWGFIGSLFVIVIFLILLARIIKVAERQRSAFSRIYGYGVASILFFHFAINIGMTMGLAPIIGIPLPFISYGGSSLWAFTILLFIFIRQDASRLEVL